ncbi:Bifunctional cytochrome P450/NADPH--P450 reductase [Fusarium falciforme]|uniref:Bifunctional cytochrome P450/NADPH--P450 reductase n=1 Tax=Fusarium falciforme TaxID=195108 RepID=UPI0023019BCB|nr:Bifunctional cytochrome P450/NADPH--P450 reductase [Fusarium falciforme]WAO87403.1 Bifunctional cytochrome P450/NADPH--P450 reductase [Fusarium falciforme]
MAETVEIPTPAGLPLLGNIKSIDPEFPLGSMVSLAEQHGEIYRLKFPGRTVVIVSTQALVNETCNEKRFKKCVNSALTEIREGVHDGLFTAKLGEENWGIAHRVLMPAFGPLSIQRMFDEMHDIASQLALKWARYGPDSPIMVTDDFTRLTLDTLALCSMGYRFNSYYSPVLHPFIEAMGDFLTEAGEKPRRLPLPGIVYRERDRKYQQDIETMRSTAKEVLDARKAGGSTRKDLLTAMLEGVDTKTGKKMTDESIMDNLITFLIAGHETTSGLLSFAFYQLLTHPEAYQLAQKEVDQVVGKGPIQVGHLSKLPYLNGVLRETLRINATIPLFTVEAFEDTLLGGKYPVKAGETILNLLAKSQLDPTVFGDDANEFKPERMFDDNFARLNKEFPNSWKPFGNGMRACIGRPFAWQEALLVMVMLLQNFNFVLDPGYELGFKQTLTIKPKDMHMRAILRDNLTPTTLERRLAGLPVSETEEANGVNGKPSDANDGVPMTVLYGSNSGTCESLAQRVATDAAEHGFHVTKIDCLDTANGNLPSDQPVVIITASYEGQPPDNAGHFVAWVEKADQETKPLKDVSYAVFGCGHKDWVQTFHRIPKLVDRTLEQLGATRLVDIGLTDASENMVFSDFEAWEDNIMWPALEARYNSESKKSSADKGLSVKSSNFRTLTLRQDVKEATVVETKTLTSSTDVKSKKKHIEVQLPEGTQYTAGDYLAVLPINPQEVVRRALRRFKLPMDAHLEISSSTPTVLPTDTSVSALDVLSSYVELSQPATKRNLLAIAEAAPDEETKAALTSLSEETYVEEVGNKRVSVLEILERYPSVDLPIGDFLQMLPSIRIRQYSISSSPLWNQSRATITFSVLKGPALSGQGTYNGVATSYLDSLADGDTLQVAIRSSPAAFSLPSNPEQTPIICIAAGSGLAPFRGFIQQRAIMIESGRKLAPSLLFFGCRAPDQDDLYRDEFDDWQKLGAVDVRRAYSRHGDGCKYVHHRIWQDKEDFIELWEKGATVYVCGSRVMADSVREVMIKVKSEMEKRSGGEMSVEEAKKWFDEQRNVRYVMDVFD